MKIVRERLTRSELQQMAAATFGSMVKGVVDVDREILALDANLHADLEAVLLDDGSDQKHLWGINLYPETAGEGFLEYDSMINLRPSQGNKSRGVDDPAIRAKIAAIVSKRVSA